MIIFGGEDQRRQINQVQGCSIQRIGTLEFDHDGGGCTTNMNDIYLCFSWEGDEKLCRKSNDPLGSFDKIGRSQFPHALTGMASSECKLLSNFTKSSKSSRTEILSANAGSWQWKILR